MGKGRNSCGVYHIALHFILKYINFILLRFNLKLQQLAANKHHQSMLTVASEYLKEDAIVLHGYDCCSMLYLDMLDVLLRRRKMLLLLVVLLLNLLRDRRCDGGRVLRPPGGRQVDALPDAVGRLAVVELAVVQPDVFLETALVVVDLVAERAAEVAQGVVVLGAVARQLDLAVKGLPAVLADVLGLFEVDLHQIHITYYLNEGSWCGSEGRTSSL